MFSEFDTGKTYTLMNGDTISGSDLKNRPGYELLSLMRCILDISGGVIRSIQGYDDFFKSLNLDPEVDDLDKANSVYIERQKRDEELRNIMPAYIKAARISAIAFTDEQALEVPDLYPAYEVDHAYKKDERFTYNGRLFKVNQAHTSAAQWVPGETGTESLYTCLEMAGDGYLVWTQPTGAHNAYNTGDIVHYPTEDDPLYKSLIDGNVWSPDAYPQGWELYTEE